MVLRSKKRNTLIQGVGAAKRKRTEPAIEESGNDLRTRHLSKYTLQGLVLTLGVGDTGQLGLGPDISERTKPARFTATSLARVRLSLSAEGDSDAAAESFVQVVAGGMHTVCLTADGRVFTFGCNDEGALGRPSTDTPSENDDDNSGPIEESRPGIVTFPEVGVQIKMISAGDSHSAALDSVGRVWLWGTFRGASGAIGLTKEGEICREPVLLNSLAGSTVVKIASGQDHLVCLTDDGRLLTMGCGEQGQLGRIAERFSKDGGRNGLDLLLHPGECRIRGFKRFDDVWAGGFATIARCMQSGTIYACGLNNYGQLALVKPSAVAEREEMEVNQQQASANPDGSVVKMSVREHLSESILAKKQGPLIQFMLTPAKGFDPGKRWTQFAIGMHHTLALTEVGEVYAVGRSDYGRLGFAVAKAGSDVSAVPHPHLVQGALAGKKCCWVGCGEACSYAVDEDGKAFSWGMGSSQQLAHEEEDADASEPGEMIGRNLTDRRVVMVDAGGQHAVMLAVAASKLEAKHSKKPVVAEGQPPTKKMRVAEVKTEASATTENNHSETPMDTTEPAAVPAPHESTSITAVTLEKPANSSSTDNPTASQLPATAASTVPEVGSAAGATVNSSSVHSCSIAVSSDQSSLGSNHSTDGGGSSRMGSSIFAQPSEVPPTSKSASTVAGGGATAVSANGAASTTGTSESGFLPTEGGSNTASPANTH